MRYVTRAFYVETPLEEGNGSLVPDIQVDGRKQVNTGLVTARGEPIMRLQDPIGFGRNND